jgi:hypothetical protein
MKMLVVFVGMILVSIAHAAEPSKQVIYSCLSGEPINSSIKVVDIKSDEITGEDDYIKGYKANFFDYKGIEIGYAESEKGNGIVYSKKLFPLKSAQHLLHSDTAVDEINIYLASFSIISDTKSRYLCVSDNLDGIGRSGSFQNVRYGYLLSLSKTRKLYFAVDDVRNLKQ